MICGKGDSKFKGAIEKKSQEKASLVNLLNKLVDLSVSHFINIYLGVIL